MIHYMIGLPGETAEEINETLAFALELWDEFRAWPAVQYATPLPGTELKFIPNGGKYIVMAARIPQNGIIGVLHHRGTGRQQARANWAPYHPLPAKGKRIERKLPEKPSQARSFQGQSAGEAFARRKDGKPPRHPKRMIQENICIVDILPASHLYHLGMFQGLPVCRGSRQSKA